MKQNSEISILKSATPSVGDALAQAAAALRGTSPTARLDAEVLVMHICEIGRSELIARQDSMLTGGQLDKLESLLARRKLGEPVAYLTGTREFWSMELNVTPATLIPRPETELLVEKALEHIPRDAGRTIADLGTGSGAIALAIGRERPRCRVIATDISSAALAVARANAGRFGLTNVEFRHGDWYAPLADTKPDMIVSNPPYIPAADPHLATGDVRFEPAQALTAGTDGLDAIRHIAQDAELHLKPGGWLMFEHGWDQAGAVSGLLRRLGYRDIVCSADLAGHARVTGGRR
jgi:release factor glutamine methyltransferase